MNRYLIQRKLRRPYATWRTLSAAHDEREARRVYLHAVASISERCGTVRLCGNSVSPPLAAAIVRANALDLSVEEAA